LTLYFPNCRAESFPVYSETTVAAIRPIGLRPTLQLSGTLCVITEGIRLYGYISMGGYIITEAEEQTRVV